jgi:hypothetical protein
MKLKLTAETVKVVENFENGYEHDVVDAMHRESELYDGLHWVHMNDLANELCSIVMLGGAEVESGSQADETMCAVLVMAYDQAFKRAAKVLGIPIKVLLTKESELTDQEENSHD